MPHASNAVQEHRGKERRERERVGDTEKKTQHPPELDSDISRRDWRNSYGGKKWGELTRRSAGEGGHRTPIGWA